MLATFARRHVWKRAAVAFANQIFTPWPLKPGNSFRWMISEPTSNMTLSVLFVVAFNVLTNVAACHLPLHQCIAIAFRILVLSVNFIASPVLQCYLAHWLSCQSHSLWWDHSVVLCSTLLEISEAILWRKHSILHDHVGNSLSWRSCVSKHENIAIF